MNYDEIYWAFIVKELGKTHIVCQTDSDEVAVKFCQNHPIAAKVIRTSDDQPIYFNC